MDVTKKNNPLQKNKFWHECGQDFFSSHFLSEYFMDVRIVLNYLYNLFLR